MAKIKKKRKTDCEIFQIPLLVSVNQDYVERAFKLFLSWSRKVSRFVITAYSLPRRKLFVDFFFQAFFVFYFLVFRINRYLQINLILSFGLIYDIIIISIICSFLRHDLKKFACHFTFLFL